MPGGAGGRPLLGPRWRRGPPVVAKVQVALVVPVVRVVRAVQIVQLLGVQIVGVHGGPGCGCRAGSSTPSLTVVRVDQLAPPSRTGRVVTLLENIDGTGGSEPASAARLRSG